MHKSKNNLMRGSSNNSVSYTELLDENSGSIHIPN